MLRGAIARCTQQVRCCIASRSFTSLPVIDVAALVDPTASKESVTAAAQALHTACKDVGFFYVQNHGVPQHVTEGVLQQAHKWFALPAEVKSSLLLSPGSHYRGYQPLGLNVTRHAAGFTPDWHEALDLFREEEPAAAKVPAFSAALRAYIAACLTLGDQLLRGIAIGMGLPEKFFAGQLAGPEGSYWVARVIHYPPLQRVDQQQQAAAGGGEVGRDVQLGCGEHCDYGLLTLVNQDPHVTALQVKNAAGQWVDAPPIPGTFVCNIGDMFQVLTNGMYKATLHRVLNTARATSRVSAPFFYEPCFEAVVAPAPQLCGGQPPLFKPVRYGSHLESKVLSNFDM